MPNKLYNERAAGVYLGGADDPISCRTMQRMRQEGTGPKYLKIGGAIRYTERHLDEHREKSVRTSTSDPGPDQPVAVARAGALGDRGSA